VRPQPGGPASGAHELPDPARDPLALARELADARERTLALLAGLSDEQVARVPLLATVNPPLWELGHVGWFQEKWLLRREPPRASVLGSRADELFDSAEVGHATRWRLPLPARDEVLDYLARVLDLALARLARGDAGDAWFARLATFHEDMHGEAFVYTRQTLGWSAPVEDRAPAAGPLPGDVEVPGGTFELGARADGSFVFDNEKWSHPVELAPFRIARAPVTQGELAEFVEAGGYRRDELWTREGLRWRVEAGAATPAYWTRDARGWSRRHFDRSVPLEEHRPAVHVNAHEAEAFCRWKGRRLPTEAEWEAAACGTAEGGGLARAKRRFPWGDAPPTPAHAALDLSSAGCADVAAFPAGDGAFGCRQMLGNVWEWTASAFTPYPGFVADPYREYSEPWFGTHRVLRGGAYATRARLVRGTWRNFFTPDRRDVIAGFRTVARGPENR